MLQALGKKDADRVHIDILDKLSRRTLGDLEATSLPDGALVDDLATQIRKLRNKSIANPFPFVDLAKWLPHWCNAGAELPSDDEQADNEQLKAIAKAMGAPSKATRHLTVLEWTIAFEQFAWAAVATQMWTVPSAFAYKRIVLELAINAPAKGRKPFVATIYDRLARKEYARLAYAGAGFDVNVSARQLDEALLRTAEAEHDRIIQDRQHKKRDAGNHSWSSASWHGKRNWGSHQHSWGNDHKRARRA